MLSARLLLIQILLFLFRFWVLFLFISEDLILEVLDTSSKIVDNLLESLPTLHLDIEPLDQVVDDVRKHLAPPAFLLNLLKTLLSHLLLFYAFFTPLGQFLAPAHAKEKNGVDSTRHTCDVYQYTETKHLINESLIVARPILPAFVDQTFPVQPTQKRNKHHSENSKRKLLSMELTG